jgi:hypothetical protein
VKMFIVLPPFSPDVTPGLSAPWAKPRGRR